MSGVGTYIADHFHHHVAACFAVVLQPGNVMGDIFRRGCLFEGILEQGADKRLIAQRRKCTASLDKLLGYITEFIGVVCQNVGPEIDAFRDGNTTGDIIDRLNICSGGDIFCRFIKRRIKRAINCRLKICLLIQRQLFVADITFYAINDFRGHKT
ncbi:hypothetical protein D3C79_542730 [compost metagenome]